MRESLIALRSHAIPLSIWMRAALSMKPFALTVTRLLVSLVLIVTTGKKKKRTNVIGGLYEKVLIVLYYFEHNINSSIFYH